MELLELDSIIVGLADGDGVDDCAPNTNISACIWKAQRIVMFCTRDDIFRRVQFSLH